MEHIYIYNLIKLFPDLNPIKDYQYTVFDCINLYYISYFVSLFLHYIHFFIHHSYETEIYVYLQVKKSFLVLHL